MTWLLCADIGGTNLRLRAFDGNHVRASEQHETNGPEDLADIFGAFAATQGTAPELVVAAAAGPVSNNQVQLTNAAKLVCGTDLRRSTGAAEAWVINDFAAAAWATARVSAEDLMCLQGAPAPSLPGTHVVVGPGTGLGVGALIPHHGTQIALPGEGGHVSLAPHTPDEIEIFEAFRRLWPETFFGSGLTCEAEAMLSGTGLPILYRAVQEVMGESGPQLSARDVLSQARTQQTAVAQRVAGFFKTHLARLSGDIGISFGADSVFLVGGVATKNPWLFDKDFATAFAQGGRFTKLRQAMNLYLLRTADFGLLGAHNYARYRKQQRAA
ncbi:MAG: ROK family protein [Pseudomonadota bacterium]